MFWTKFLPALFRVEVVKMSREQKWLICYDPQVEEKKLDLDLRPVFCAEVPGFKWWHNNCMFLADDFSGCLIFSCRLPVY